MNDCNSKRCPSCNELNHCAVVSGGDIKDCWCNKTKEVLTKEQIDHISKKVNFTTCLCKKCIKTYMSKDEAEVLSN